MKNAGFAIELIDVKTVEKSQPVLYNKDIGKSLQKQALLPCNEYVTVRSRHNVWEAACHAVNFKCFEKFGVVRIRWALCMGKKKVYWKGKESIGP